jgi:hypothetical protein
MARMITTGHLSSASSVARRASTVTGWSSTPTKPPAGTSSKPVFLQTVRCCLPMKRPTTWVCTPSMAPSDTPGTNGRAMMTATVFAKSTAIPAKGWELPCVPIYACFGVSINTIWSSIWRLLRHCSTPKPSRLLSSSVCALVTIDPPETHEPQP